MHTDFFCSVLLDLWGTCSVSRPCVCGELSIKIPEHRSEFVSPALSHGDQNKKDEETQAGQIHCYVDAGRQRLCYFNFFFFFCYRRLDMEARVGIAFCGRKQAESSKARGSRSQGSQPGLYTRLIFNSYCCLGPAPEIFIWLVGDAAWALGLLKALWMIRMGSHG